jgi:membrane protease YdiL (CAAX protease family)
MNEIKLEEILYPRRIKFFGVGTQVTSVAILFAAYTALSFYQYQSTGTMWGYPLRISILFVPIYEELIFRGVILAGLTRFYSARKAIIISSLLFGLWHFKNIFFISTHDLVSQMLYTALIFGPVAAYLTLRTKNVWLAVILHYLNNMIAPFSAVLLALLLNR